MLLFSIVRVWLVVVLPVFALVFSWFVCGFGLYFGCFRFVGCVVCCCLCWFVLLLSVYSVCLWFGAFVVFFEFAFADFVACLIYVVCFVLCCFRVGCDYVGISLWHVVALVGFGVCFRWF